jgi:hypothetical protein
MGPRTLTTIAGIAVGLIAAQSLGMFGGGAPTILSPVSIPLAIPAFLGVPPSLVVLAFVAIFWLWCAPLFAGKISVPKRTGVLLMVVGALSTIAFAIGWRFGMEYQGLAHIAVCILASAAMLAFCIFFFRRVHKHPSFGGSLLLHTLIFVWIASYALPYLGETP